MFSFICLYLSLRKIYPLCLGRAHPDDDYDAGDDSNISFGNISGEKTSRGAGLCCIGLVAACCM